MAAEEADKQIVPVRVCGRRVTDIPTRRSWVGPAGSPWLGMKKWTRSLLHSVTVVGHSARGRREFASGRVCELASLQ